MTDEQETPHVMPFIGEPEERFTVPMLPRIPPLPAEPLMETKRNVEALHLLDRIEQTLPDLEADDVEGLKVQLKAVVAVVRSLAQGP